MHLYGHEYKPSPTYVDSILNAKVRNTPAEVAAAGRFVDKHCPDNGLIRAMLGIGGER